MYFGAHQAARVAMQRRHSPLQTVLLHKSTLEACRVGKHEILIEGRLYDICGSVSEGDSLRLRLYHDRHEEALLLTLGHILSPAGDGHVLQWLAQWLGQPFLQPDLQCWPALHSHFTVCQFTKDRLSPQSAPGCAAPPPKRLTEFS